MRENKLFTRAAFYGRKTLTISTTKEQLMRHIKLKQQHEEERQQKQHEQILCVITICTATIHRAILLDIAAVRRIGTQIVI